MYRILQFFFKKRHLVSIENNKTKGIVLFIILLWYSTSGFLFFELPAKPDLQWTDALWWSFVTMTTVGYGDYFPVNSGGRYLIGIPVMVFGIGFLGFIISEVASGLIETRSRRLQGKMIFKKKEHILIINYCRLENVLTIIKELKSDSLTAKKDICLVDETLEELPMELVEQKVSFVKGDPTREEVMEQANLREASHALILSKDPGDSHSDDQNLATALVIENIHPDVFSVVEVVNPKKIKQFKMAGCDSIVCVSELTSNLVIQELQDPGVLKVIRELTSNSFGQQLYLASIKQMRNWDFEELVAWGVDNNYSVLGILTESGVVLNCCGNERITVDDKAILIGKQRVDTVNIV